MPKKQKMKKPETKCPPTEPCVKLQFSETSLEEKELNLLEDLNDDFFSAANKTVQTLMEGTRFYEASKIKKYVDIIFNLHRKYRDEVKETTVLRPQVFRAEQKLCLALELTATSEQAMERLRDALETAWNESDASYRREQETQERLHDFIRQCEHYESKVARGPDEDGELGQLAKYKNIILRERDRLNGEVIDLEKRLQFQRYYGESLEYINKSLEDELDQVKLRVRVLEKENTNFEVKNRALLNRLDDQRELNMRTLTKLESVNKELMETQTKLDRKTTESDALKLTIEKVRDDNALYVKQLGNNEIEMNDMKRIQKETEEMVKILRLEDKAKGNTINLLTNKYKKAVQDHAAVSSKLYKLNRANHSLGDDIARLKGQINSLEKDLLTAVFNFEEQRRLKESIHHERDTLRSDIIKLNNTIADLRHSIVVQNNDIDGLNLDIKKLNLKLDEGRLKLSKAESERDEMAQEVDTLNERIEYYQEQIENKTDQVNELTEKLQQQQLNLIKVKKHLEDAHSEKMVMKRSLETCTQERDNFRVLQMKTNHQIAQLTTEIATNQKKINNLNSQIEKLTNDKKDLQSQLTQKESILSGVRKDLREMKHKNDNLLKTIENDEMKFMKISQELANARKEKNLIGLQMVRRNDEIVALRDKMGIIQMALDHGQSQYNQRVQDIKLLKIEITNLRLERDCLAKAKRSTADMRDEIVRLERLLNEERIQLRALTEDAQTPTGVHRWRILKGKDPDRFHLLQKVQTLQRRNLKLESEKQGLRKELEGSKEVSESMKRIIDNLPTEKVIQKLVVTQRANRAQEKKLKLLNAELYIHRVELEARDVCSVERQISDNSTQTESSNALSKCTECTVQSNDGATTHSRPAPSKKRSGSLKGFKPSK